MPAHASGASTFPFFFNDTATTEIYTLSLHDALPIWRYAYAITEPGAGSDPSRLATTARRDRKSTRLNSSHVEISYAVFCLKKKTKMHRCDPSIDPHAVRLPSQWSRFTPAGTRALADV